MKNVVAKCSSRANKGTHSINGKPPVSGLQESQLNVDDDPTPSNRFQWDNTKEEILSIENNPCHWHINGEKK